MFKNPPCDAGNLGSIPRRETKVLSAGEESACDAGDLGSVPGLGRSPGEGKGYPLQYSGLENSMDYIVHGVAKSRTRLSNLQFTMPVLWTAYRSL